jgi:hypothetical protein
MPPRSRGGARTLPSPAPHRRRHRLLRLLCLLAASFSALPRAARAASVFNRVIPGGDAGAYGAAGPTGRSGAVAVSTDDSRVLLFGGRGDHHNGDFLNDMWLFDWYTGACAC